MKLTLKRKFQNLVDQIAFPIFFYIYESGKIIAANEGANLLLGNETKSIGHIWKDGGKKKISERLMKNGSVLLKREILKGEEYSLEVDMELFDLRVDEEHIIVVLLEQSYKKAFSETRKNGIPRILWKDRHLHVRGQNLASQRMQGENPKIEPGYMTDNPYDKAGIAKVFALEEELMREQKESYGVLQQVGLQEKKRGFAQVNRLPLINRNGDCEGLLIIYELLLEREEGNRELSRLLRQTAVLEDCLLRSRMIAYSVELNERGKIDYLSAGIGRLGYCPEEFYRGELNWRDIVCEEDRKKLSIRENPMEEIEFRIYTKDKKRVRIHIKPQKYTRYQDKMFCQGVLWQVEEA